MNISFIALGTEQLGISQLSAIAKKEGHKVNLAFSAQLFHDRFNLEFPSISPYFDDTKNVIEDLRKQKPDVIAFGALTSTYQWGLNVADAAKQINPDVKVVFGGVHTSAVPDLVIAKPQVDFAVAGEGDIAIAKILHQIQKQDYSTPIVNTRFKNSDGKIIRGMQSAFIQDLDSLPFYDKQLWEDHVRLGDLYLTMASRGCPYRCTFCFNNFFANLPEEKSGKYVRLRSVEHVLTELKWAKKRYKLRYIDFQDDVFTTSKNWLKEFTYRYKKEINLPYQILTHPKYMDEEVARWLSESGCVWVQMGVQSMDENFKKDTLMRYEKSDHVSMALQLMHKYHLKAKIDHMFGLPEEPISAQETALNLYSTHYPKRIQTFWTCYLPGTAMMNEAQEKGKITEEQVNRINEGIDFYFFRNTDNIKEPEKVKLYKAYEVLFRIMPSLPQWLRTRIKPQHLYFIPGFLVRPMSILSDVITGFLYGNPEFTAYAKHNIFHLLNFFSMLIFSKRLTATKINKEN
jgi:anaerobic magnesium-protoporphyrin IX monomethyl ester cyclase